MMIYNLHITWKDSLPRIDYMKILGKLVTSDVLRVVMPKKYVGQNSCVIQIDLYEDSDSDFDAIMTSITDNMQSSDYAYEVVSLVCEEMSSDDADLFESKRKIMISNGDFNDL